MKKLLSVLLTFCLVTGLMPTAQAASWSNTLVDVDSATAGDQYFSSGSGTSTDPYEIDTAQELANLSVLVNNEIGGYPANCYELTADVNLDSAAWTPVGSYSRPFKGIFNGNGYAVKGLNVSASYSGLFGYVDGGTVKNLSVSGTMTGNIVGGVSGGIGNGTIQNCCSACTVTGGENSNIGGVVGLVNGGTIQNCYRTGLAAGGANSNIGGVVGWNQAAIRNCYSIGTLSGGTYAGGIAGKNTSTVKNCYWLGATAANAVGTGSGDVNNMMSFDATQKLSDTAVIVVGSVVTPCTTLLSALNAFSPGAWSSSSGLNGGYPMLTDAWSGDIATSYASGNGTEESPYQIATGAQLAYLAQQANAGIDYAGTYFLLTHDINLNNKPWTPIGYFYTGFKGNFNGSGHTISGLYCNGDDFSALFSQVYGVIESLALSGEVSSSGYDVGGIAARNFGTIKNCWSSVKATTTGATKSAGGIAAVNQGGTISNCYNTGAISGAGYAGGIVGYAYVSGTIENCYSIGEVIGNSAGGIAGISYSPTIIKNCYWMGSSPVKGSGSGTETACCSFDSAQVFSSSIMVGGISCATLLDALNAYSPNTWFLSARVNSGYPILQPLEAAPGAAIDYQTEKLTGLTAGADYIVGSTTYTAGAGSEVNMGSAWLGQTLAITKKGNGSATLDSDPQSLTVPARPVAPSAPVLSGKTIASITVTAVSGQEYRIGSGSWQDSNVFSGLAANTAYNIYTRTKAVSGSAFASEISSALSVNTFSKEATPSVSIDYINETLTGLTAGANYKINATSYTANAAGTVSIDSAWFGTTVPIVKSGDGSATLDSEAQSLTVPTRPVAPTGVAGSAGSITGVSTTMEYSVSGTSWTACTGTTVTGLSAGACYVRYQATGAAFASATANVTVTAATYAITAAPLSLDFGSTQAGYTAAPPAQTVTIENTGNLSVTLAQPSSTSYDIGTLSQSTLAPAAKATFTVRPKMGLSVGSHSENITINAGSAIAQVSAAFTTLSGGGGGGTSVTTPSYNASVSGTDASGKAISQTALEITVSQSQKTAAVKTGSEQSQTIASGGTVVVTIPSIPDVTTYTVALPTASLSNAGGTGGLTLQTDAGNVALRANMLAGIAGTAGKNAEISIATADKSALPEAVKAAIGTKPIIRLTLSIDGKQTDWSNSKAPVTVSIPYKPTAEELAHPESIVIWYIDGSGNVVTIPSGHYDKTTGMVTFNTTHFSDYAVAYNKVSFTDVSDSAWYHDAVTFLAARGITSGTTAATFSPDATLTRGQFITMLLRAYGITADINPTDNFSDAGSTYYTGYLAAAKRLGITSGVGDNKFAPDAAITRQEMFTLLYNALKALGKLPSGTSGKALSDFSDAGNIASWATDAMTALVKAGTVSGSGSKLNPTGTTTRAEMAQVLYNLLGK